MNRKPGHPAPGGCRLIAARRKAAPTVRLVAVCGLLAASAGGCARQREKPSRPPTPVQTAIAEKMDTPTVVSAFGSTKDRLSVDIIPQVSGLLVETFMRDGAAVTNGQPLFQIDPRDYAARVRQAEGMVAADRANLALNRSTLERNRQLREKELVSREDFDTLKTRVDAAEAQLRMDEAALDQARLNLERCTITAPLDGICSKREVDDGNLVTAGQTRLTNIRAYDPMFVDFSVPEAYLPLLRRALAEGPVRLEIVPRGDTNVYAGTLKFLDNAVSADTGTILLRGQAPNPELKLWAQQFVEVRVFAGVIRDAVMVPEGAVQFGKRGTYVFVVSRGDVADMRTVTTGLVCNGLIQILQGVEPGEKVVVLGHLMLYPGARVAEAGPPAAGGMPGPGPAGAGGK
jgi:membrane fusion protein, multidrug efflux system